MAAIFPLPPVSSIRIQGEPLRVHPLPEPRERDVVHGFENPGKVEGVLEPERGGHGFHRGAAFQQVSSVPADGARLADPFS